MIPSYVWTIVFYSVIILLLIIFRKKFEKQGVIFLYRTKVGVNFINRFAKKHERSIKFFGLAGIGIAVLGIIAIVILLFHNLYNLITQPSAQSGVSLILPGVHIPGSPITIPLITGWISLFIVIIVHEACHGIVGKANGLDIKSSGLAFLGPIAGAFVEPDEKKLLKKDDAVKHSVFAAGPVANIILGVIAFLLIIAVFTPLTNAITTPVGFSIGNVQDGYPAKEAGITGGMIITEINGVKIVDYEQFKDEISTIKPHEQVNITANNTLFTLVTAEHPDNPRKPYFGISNIKNERVLKNKSQGMKIFFAVFKWIEEVVVLLFILGIGIGMANLLPLGPIDGGRILEAAASSIFGIKKGRKIWIKVSWFVLLLLLINILFPLFRWIFLKF